jgi:hypothetical protein
VKDAVDAMRGSFALTGSSRPADEAAARGQMELAPDEGQITDFGEKIGGARKDTAKPVGQRAQAEAEESAEPGWRKRYSVTEIAASADPSEKGKWVIRDLRSKDWHGQPRQVGQPFSSKEAAEKAVELAAVARQHRVVMGRSDTEGKSKYTIWRDVTDRKRVQVVKQEFDTREDAMRHMAEHAVEIIETKTAYGEEILAKPEKVKRTGAERRTAPRPPRCSAIPSASAASNSATGTIRKSVRT